MDGERYVGEMVELVSADEYDDLGGEKGCIEKEGSTVHWNRVAWRDHDGTFHLAYDHPQLDGAGATGDADRRCDLRFFHHLADATDRPVEDVEAEFHRKHQYVRYMVSEGMDDFDAVFGFLADLHNDETATVERLRRWRKRQ